MRLPISRRAILLAVAVIAAPAVVVTAVADKKAPAAPDDPLIAGFKATYPASVSDAVEIVTGKSGTMRHDMKLVTGKAMVGRAVTSLARPAPPEVLKKSKEIDDRESGMFPFIRREKSLEKAIELFGRI